MVQVLADCKLDVHEYHRMAEARVLGEDDRVELIEGEIIEMTPISQRHAACVNRLNRLFSRLAERAAIVSVQNPIRLDDSSEPEPDLALLRYRDDYYSLSHPSATGVLLVVEVAETSVEYDRNVKLQLYARAGICEAWLVDLRAETIEVRQSPSPDGYRKQAVRSPGEQVSPQHFPELELAVSEIIGGMTASRCAE